jgi:hypothetical protein
MRPVRSLSAPREMAERRHVTLIMDQHLPCSTQEAKNRTKELCKVITREGAGGGWRQAVALMVETLCYKPSVRVFETG